MQKAKNSNCNVCGNPKSRYVMNNKLVCMKCDELLFDLEIECEEVEKPATESTTTTPTIRRVAPAIKK